MKYPIFRLCICGMFVLSFCGCINSQNKKTLKTFPKTEKKIDVRSLVEQMRKDRNPRREIEGLGLFFQENQRAKKDGTFHLYSRSELEFDTPAGSEITTIRHNKKVINGLLNFEADPNILVSLWVKNGIPDGFVVVYYKVPHILLLSKGIYKDGKPFFGGFSYSFKYNQLSPYQLYYRDGNFMFYSILNSSLSPFENIYSENKLINGYQLISAIPGQPLRLKRYQDGIPREEVTSDSFPGPSKHAQLSYKDFLFNVKAHKQRHLRQWKKMKFDW